jgi:hypothetical protein
MNSLYSRVVSSTPDGPILPKGTSVPLSRVSTCGWVQRSVSTQKTRWVQRSVSIQRTRSQNEGAHLTLICVCVCVGGGGIVVSEKWTELHWGPSPRAHTHLAFVWHVASDSERRVLVGRHPYGETRVGNLTPQQRSQVKSSKKQSQGLNAVHVRGRLTLRMCSKRKCVG